MPGIVSKSHRAAGDKNVVTHVFRRVRMAQQPSDLSDAIRNHPVMYRLVTFPESMPVEEQILEFSALSPEEEEQEQEQEQEHPEEEIIHETEEARRAREIEEDRKNYMNRFFR